MILEMKSPDKIILISDSVSGPGWGSGPIRGPGGALLGSGITLPDAIRNLAALGIPAEQVLRFASDNPMRYLGMVSAS